MGKCSLNTITLKSRIHYCTCTVCICQHSQLKAVETQLNRLKLNIIIKKEFVGSQKPVKSKGKLPYRRGSVAMSRFNLLSLPLLADARFVGRGGPCSGCQWLWAPAAMLVV